MEELKIGGRAFSSRLFVGTGKFSSNEMMRDAIIASGSQMVTVALKRIDTDNREDDMLRHILRPVIYKQTAAIKDAQILAFARSEEHTSELQSR